MQLSVKGKQLDVGDALRTHIADSLNTTAAKYFGNPLDASVVLSREAHFFRADVSVHVGRNILMQSNAEGGDAYQAFDQAAEKIGKRLRRYKRRLKDHHKPNGASAPEDALSARSYVLEAGGEGEMDGDELSQPVVVAEMTTPIETLTVSDAVMRLDLGDLPALMFRNVSHGGLNMIYRRPDGNVGWVDPRGTKETSA